MAMFGTALGGTYSENKTFEKRSYLAVPVLFSESLSTHGRILTRFSTVRFKIMINFKKALRGFVAGNFSFPLPVSKIWELAREQFSKFEIYGTVGSGMEI